MKYLDGSKIRHDTVQYSVKTAAHIHDGRLYVKNAYYMSRSGRYGNGIYSSKCDLQYQSLCPPGVNLYRH
jgi:hypothetical protein